MDSTKQIFKQTPVGVFLVLGSALFLAACLGLESTSQKAGATPPSEAHLIPSRIAAGGTAAPSKPAVEPSTPTPRPNITPSSTPPSPSPLPQSVLTSCPVSLPQPAESSHPNFSAENSFGNPERTMFIGLWPNGIVYFCPNCAGTLSADGSLAMKFGSYRTIPGEVVLEGRRLDEPGPMAELATLRGPADGYGETGFHPAGLVFPSQGCWEVTARIGEAHMTFVTLVLWISFDPLWLGWLPQGMLHEKTNLSGYPNAFELAYGSAEGGRVIVETRQGSSKVSYPAAVQESVTVDGSPGTCFQRVGNKADAGALNWSSGALSYHIRYFDLELTCVDLVRMASQPG